MADTSPQSAPPGRLSELARAHGIAPEYYDIWGTPRCAPDASLRALLGAIGVTADTPDAVETAIRARELQRWQALLPPVIVVREDGASQWRVRLNLSEALEAAGIEWRFVEEGGTLREGAFLPHELESPEQAEIAGKRFVARELPLPINPPPGYHRLEILRAGILEAATTCIVTPSRCDRPRAIEGEGKVWGPAVQLYALRSARNWGIGDFTDLCAIIEQCAQRGAGIVGVSPLHALFPHNPAHASPYCPSSRLFLNVLHLDIEAIDDFHACQQAIELTCSAGFQSRLNGLRQAELVDYSGVAEAKFPLLEMLYAHFRAQHLSADTARGREFRAFQALAGRALRLHALFEALQQHFHRADPSVWGWPAWPEPWRNPASPAVAGFAEEHLERVEFFEYLQWQADIQLGRAGQRARELGLGIGLYEDLAVSADRGGAEAWANRDLYALAASVGAPPDDFNLAGQDWGLPPLIPERLRAAAYAPFVATLRANMRQSGALRIDHVMGLARLFWIPPAGRPIDGCYVHYPLADLLGILALESQRSRCLVIGEDLGTVPDEVRAALSQFGVLAYRLLYFERQHSGEFKPPADYPADALVAATTHDLPTLAGYWQGSDLTLRAGLGLYPSEQARQALVVGRAQDRARLLRALEREGLLPAGVSLDPASLPEMTPELALALHLFLARTPAKVLVVQLEDVLGVSDQANLPGTTSEHPNWQRKLPLPIERLPADERFVQLTRALSTRSRQ